MRHECIIGLLCKSDYSELTTFSELKEHIAERINENNNLRNYGLTSDFWLLDEWTMKDYADKRKSTNLTRFDFCPYCGKKIDWKAIRKEGEHETDRR